MLESKRRQKAPVNKAESNLQPFLEAQRLRPASSVEELRQASASVDSEVMKILGKSDALEAWIAASNDLEQAFLNGSDGALGKRLLELRAMDDETFAMHRNEAEAMIRQTSVAASCVYPLIHRLQTLAFGATRNEVIEKLSRGDLTTQVRVENVSVTPMRETLIGALRALDARVGAMNVWSLEKAPEILGSIVVADPFDASSTELAGFWEERILAKGKVAPDREHGILSISGDVTGSLAFELEQIHERAKASETCEAAQIILDFLNRKSLYYQAPDERDFELYHLGMEQPDVLMALFRALDTIKHANPEFFLEMVGINPKDGGRSTLFGSFMHKALYNTQRVIHRTQPESGDMALGVMMHQLMTMNGHVQTYVGVVSREALKAMAEKIHASVDAETDPASKARQRIMTIPFYLAFAIDEQVRRELAALREVNGEKIHEELVRHLHDIEHPLKAMDYIASMPLAAFEHPDIQFSIVHSLGLEKEFFQADPRASGSRLVEECAKREGSVIAKMYARIPLIDEKRPDLGFGLRFRIAIRDAVHMTNPLGEFYEHLGRVYIKAHIFLEQATFSGHLFREDFDAIKGQLTMYERFIAERLDEYSFHRIFSVRKVVLVEGRLSDGDRSIFISAIKILERIPKKDWPFFLGQMLIDFQEAKDRYAVESREAIEGLIEHHEPDKVFLTLLGNPKGTDVAFKYFDRFCDLIPAERLVQILRLPNERIKALRDKFQKDSFVFECNESQIAYSVDQINESTKVYIGKLEPGIFDRLPETVEHVYTKFPEGHIRCQSIEIGGKDEHEFEQLFKRDGHCFDYAWWMFEHDDFKRSLREPDSKQPDWKKWKLKSPEEVRLIRLRVKDLGFPSGATTDQIFAKAQELGLELCPPEVGPQFRLHYIDQPMDEYVYVGMKQITDSGSHPSVFDVARGVDGSRLSRDWAKPRDEWDANDEFVFRLRKSTQAKR